MAKRTKLTKKMLQNFQHGELRYIAQVGMDLPRFEAFTYKYKNLVDWVYQNSGDFAEVEIDPLDKDHFRDSVKDYAKALQRMVAGQGPAPPWPYDEEVPEVAVQADLLEEKAVEGTKEASSTGEVVAELLAEPPPREVASSQEEEETPQTEQSSSDHTKHVPREYLTASGRPDLRRKEVREILGKPPLRRRRRADPKRTDSPEQKSSQTTPERELPSTSVGLKQQLSAELNQIEKRLRASEEQSRRIENALLYILNIGEEFRVAANTDHPYETLDQVPKPKDYLHDDPNM
ncbi:MAG: hypothetical protein CMA70_04790 [Euryarchaeota archaeon]|nr:hypothetical protein [Euryarchaeota archaeon]